MQIDAYYQGKYADSVSKGIDLLKDGITWAKINCDFMHLDEECDPISSEEWRGFLSRQNTQGKLKAFVKRYAPWLGYIYSNVR